MKQIFKDTLRQAALDGVKQTKGYFFKGDGSMCALGVLLKKFYFDELQGDMGVRTGFTNCPICPYIESEMNLVVHLNDDHGLDFLAIAEKMPTSEER